MNNVWFCIYIDYSILKLFHHFSLFIIHFSFFSFLFHLEKCHDPSTERMEYRKLILFCYAIFTVPSTFNEYTHEYDHHDDREYRYILKDREQHKYGSNDYQEQKYCPPSQRLFEMERLEIALFLIVECYDNDPYQEIHHHCPLFLGTTGHIHLFGGFSYHRCHRFWG